MISTIRHNAFRRAGKNAPLPDPDAIKAKQMQEYAEYMRSHQADPILAISQGIMSPHHPLDLRGYGSVWNDRHGSDVSIGPKLSKADVERMHHAESESQKLCQNLTDEQKKILAELEAREAMSPLKLEED